MWSYQQYDIPKRSIYFFRQNLTVAEQLVNLQINFVLPQKRKYPGRLLQHVLKSLDYTPKDLLRMYHSGEVAIAPFYSGVLCNVINMMTYIFKLIWHEVSSAFFREYSRKISICVSQYHCLGRHHGQCSYGYLCSFPRGSRPTDGMFNIFCTHMFDIFRILSSFRL